MRKYSIFLVFIIFFGLDLFSQGHFFWLDYQNNRVFVDSTNVRSAPSIESERMGFLRHNQQVLKCRDGGVNDTIQGVEGYWYAIDFNGNIGYVWSRTLVGSHLKSLSNLDHSILIHYAPVEKKLGFKVFNADTMFAENYIEEPITSGFSAVSIGDTYNSDGREIIVIQYYEGHYKLYAWDGDQVTPFDGGLLDDSFITGTYDTYHKTIINSDRVRAHSNPAKESEVLFVLPLFSVLDSVEHGVRQEELDGEYWTWEKVYYQGQQGYVWGKYVSSPERYIRSNKDPDEYYLQTSSAIFVLNKDTISSVYRGHMRCDAFYNRGSMGLDRSNQFLTVVNEGGSCGTWSGESYYRWNGNNIKGIGSSGGIGDGGYSEGHELVFPFAEGGEKEKVLLLEYIEESVSVPSIDCHPNYTTSIFYHDKKELVFDGDTLVEIPSKNQNMKNFIAKQFPNYHVFSYAFGDVNLDGIEDVICVISEEEYSHDYTPPQNAKGVVLFGVADGSFQWMDVNTDLFSRGLGTRLSIEDAKIMVTLLGEDYHQYAFVYNAEDNKIYWYSITHATPINPYGEWQEAEIDFFKSSKISFGKTWVQ